MTKQRFTTPVSTVVGTQKRNSSSSIHEPSVDLRKNQSKQSATWVPANARDLVLDEADIAAGFTTAEDEFVGPNTLIRRGQVEPDRSHAVVPFKAVLRFRPTATFRRAWKNVRAAVLHGLDLRELSYALTDRFTGPHTVIREMDYELEDGTVLPVVWHIKFGRPFLTN
jgi:hypothetical protein